MPRTKKSTAILHEFDVMLCHYVAGVIQGKARDDEVGTLHDALQARLSSSLFGYVMEGGSSTVLLLASDFEDLVSALSRIPDADDRYWEAYTPLHRRHAACTLAIRREIASAFAERFSRQSEEFAAALEQERVPLHHGVDVIRRWTVEVRHALQALGAYRYLPYPQGLAPTLYGAPPAHGHVEPEQGAQAASTEPKWLSVEAIRRRVRCRREGVIAAMDAGELPYEKRGRARYVRLIDIEAWEEKRVKRDAASSTQRIHADLQRYL